MTMVIDNKRINRVLREEIDSFLESSLIMEDVNPFDVLRNDGINIGKVLEILQKKDTSNCSPNAQKAVYDITYFVCQVCNAIDRCVSHGNINEAFRISDYGIEIPHNLNTQGAYLRGYNKAKNYFRRRKQNKNASSSRYQAIDKSSVQDERLETLLNRNFPVVEGKYQANKRELNMHVPEVYRILSYIKETLIPNFNAAKNRGT